jgi:hypothetical protein
MNKKIGLFIFSFAFLNLHPFAIRRLDEQVIAISRAQTAKSILINKILKNTLLVAPATILGGALVYKYVLHGELFEDTLRDDVNRLKAENLLFKEYFKLNKVQDEKLDSNSDIIEKSGFFQTVGNFFQSKIDFVVSAVRNSIPVVGALVLRQALFGGFVSKISSSVGEIFEERNIYWAAKKGSVVSILENLKAEALVVNPDVNGIKADLANSLQKVTSRIEELELNQASFESFSKNLGDSVKLAVADKGSVLTGASLNSHLGAIEILSNTLISSLERLIAFMEFKHSKLSDVDRKRESQKIIEIVRVSTNNFSEAIEKFLNGDSPKLLSEVVGFQVFLVNILDVFSEFED